MSRAADRFRDIVPGEASMSSSSSQLESGSVTGSPLPPVGGLRKQQKESGKAMPAAACSDAVDEYLLEKGIKEGSEQWLRMKSSKQVRDFAQAHKARS